MKNISFFFIAMLLITSCNGDSFNPCDAKSVADPAAWAPKNGVVNYLEGRTVQVSWDYSYEEYEIDGFKVDRQIGNQPVEEDYQNVGFDKKAFEVVLEPNKEYSYRIYSYCGGNVSASIELKYIMTFAETVTGEPENITNNSAEVSGTVSADGGATVTEKGVCFDITPNPTIEKNKINGGVGTGDFSISLTGLTDQTVYYIRAYAINGVGTSYGEEKEFETSITVNLPTITTELVTNITESTASCGGEISSDGNAPVTSRGLCWGTSENPTIDNNSTNDGTGEGSFTSNLTGLSASTTYYARAYAENSAGISYGNQVNFTTSEPVSIPTVSTKVLTDIEHSSAVGGGNVTNDGGGSVSARGVCWSTSQNPTPSDNKTTDGNGLGDYTSNLTGLSANTTYYVRAYAINSAGTGYGNQMNFTTLEAVSIPNITTTAVSVITQSAANGGGVVLSGGGATVTVRGVCWSTSQNPTTSSSKTTDGAGVGVFTSSITSLSANTKYYVRAYATNSAGTGYGNQVNFTTLMADKIPSVNTSVISSITQTSALGGGNVSNDGGAMVTVRGVCWSTSQNPTTNSSKTTDGTGEGDFISSLSGLSPNTTYYVRSYATNSAGTGYGSQRNFKTLEEENGEWIQYDDNSFEYYAKTGDTGRLFMRFSMPTGWQAAKMTKVMISLSSSFSPFDIEVCDEYILTNDNIKLPSQNLSKVRLSLSQSSGWRTHIVDQNLTSPEFFILLYSNSDDGPRVLADVDHPDNFYRCGTIIGNEIATWSTVCLAIRIYLEEITEPISNPDLITNTHQDNLSQGIWLEVSLMELLENGNVKKLSNSELAKQKK